MSAREDHGMTVTHQIHLPPCAYLPSQDGTADGCGGDGEVGSGDEAGVPILYTDRWK